MLEAFFAGPQGFLGELFLGEYIKFRLTACRTLGDFGLGAGQHRLRPGACLAQSLLILLGGALLTLADTLARIAVPPRQLPVGALTALIGVPLFLILMRRERRITF